MPLSLRRRDPAADRTAVHVLPDIDDRLIQPDTRYEIMDGVVRYVSPSHPAHGERQVQLVVLLRAHVRRNYTVASEVLTRTSLIDDFAPDASVYPSAKHPVTGKRQLDHLAFEVVSEQSMSVPTRKAAKLVARGVRRVFAIHIKRSLILEWSAKRGRWRKIEDEYIEDPVLIVPLPVKALIHAVDTDDVVARALIARRNPVLEADRARSLAKGVVKGKRDMLSMLLQSRGIAVDRTSRRQIARERDPDRLDRWLLRAMHCTAVAELFTEP